MPFIAYPLRTFSTTKEKEENRKAVPSFSWGLSWYLRLSTTQQGIDFVHNAAFEPVSSQLAVFFHMADDRFHRIAAPQLFFDCRCSTSALTGDEDRRWFYAITTIPPVNIAALRDDVGHPFHLVDPPCQRMAVKGIARQGLHAHHKIICWWWPRLPWHRIRIILHLALGNAFNFRRMDAVQFALVLLLLC